MSEIANFWNLILESNTFNFIVLLVLLVAVMQKLHVAEAVEKLKSDIVYAIETSRLAKENAQKNYKDAKHKIEHIEEEISEKLSLASTQADNVAGSILETTERKLKQIENNVKKVIEAEEKTLVTSMTEQTANASVELARNYVISRLHREPELHNKYIEESIEELGKVKI